VDRAPEWAASAEGRAPGQAVTAPEAPAGGLAPVWARARVAPIGSASLQRTNSNASWPPWGRRMVVSHIRTQAARSYTSITGSV
jgi:hypothetical protein